ncbi:ABC transporter substrate-binding protein [Kibdelosporangium phytohabitans]|uniref:ABC transporter substrate-binding protein n=1 Tax=Kibdelosporangium phytohabitans TaxID=860235 RepID=A0A0N9HWT1_9PSEU|nr:ABC transporter substrate-binding protein [Kibdelosporangium phytohabitans]ALG07600.1 ABC transporter substrate-binding protein [Kibdelosporangium phytohabitans]MBE1471452.1 polar amino acid transport system substrate-binding protein [Kibdelosporangium phytohabitans]
MRRIALLLASLVALSACGGPADAGKPAQNKAGVNTSPDQNRVRATKNEQIAAKVPQAIRDRGELVVGVDGKGSPPLTFRADDDKTPVGVETDIAQLVADTLGLKLRFEPTSWENLFLSVESGQYDVGFSNITVTEERKDKYDFATYRVDTIAFETSTGNNITVSGPKDIAGRRVAVTSGTNQEQILLRWDAANKAAGLKPVEFQYYTNASDRYLALKSGRIELYVGPYPGSAYHAKVSGETKIVGQVSGGGEIPAQIAGMTKKGSGLVTPVADALNELIKNGEYAEVLARWNLANEAITRSEINPPGLPRK